MGRGPGFLANERSVPKPVPLPSLVKNLWVAPAGYLRVIECAESLFYRRLSASSLACSQDA